MARVRPWEQWRFDALVEASRQHLFGGEEYRESVVWAGYLQERRHRLPVLLAPI